MTRPLEAGRGHVLAYPTQEPVRMSVALRRPHKWIKISARNGIHTVLRRQG